MDEMNFKQLYVDCKKEITKAIVGMWKENAPQMVKQYENQLQNIANGLIGDKIVVENMSRWESTNEDWRKIVNESIWQRRKKDDENNFEPIPYSPYKHQVESWKVLLDDKKPKSIVVTTGTGSGKTECFMVPLIHDLTKESNYVRKQAVEAIFLYPLNALMEDQKGRINDYIECNSKDLRFAVYNSNTPEDKGDEDGKLYELTTRRSIRTEKPNILFTNPSMLEYMLLRHEDKDLFTSDLKWIVIDETHTYKGAAGAELAMLIRRVLKACGKKAEDVRFVTSSATIGDSDDKLLDFISGITGLKSTEIEIIKGQRSEPNTKDIRIKKTLLNPENDFILLSDLIQDGNSIEEKLDKIDNLAKDGLRVRLHYYLQTLNRGLYIDIAQLEEGTNRFKLHKDIPLVDGKLDSHYLEAYYCTKCGSLLGYGELKDDNSYTFKSRNILESLDGDIEDDVVNDGKNETLPDFHIGLMSNSFVKKSEYRNLNKEGQLVAGDIYSQFVLKRLEINKETSKYTHYCPCCGAHGSGGKNPLKSFYMSADDISRLIAPILLKQTTPFENGKETLPYEGRKYITFADSRQSVAGPSLKQNLETEKTWVTGVLLNSLMKKQLSDKDRKEKEQQIQEAFSKSDFKLVNKLSQELICGKKYITWVEALDELFNDTNCERMYLAFAKKGEEYSEQERRKYVAAALYRVLGSRKQFGDNSPENCGLFCTIYPDLLPLKDRKDLPETIIKLNNIISSQENKISAEDWYAFVKLFVDLSIRSDNSFFFQASKNKNSDWYKIDIKSCRNYQTQYSPRKPINVFGENNRFTHLLINLLGKQKWSELDNDQKELVRDVAEKQLLEDLNSYKIREISESIEWEENHTDVKNWKEDKDEDDNPLYYMNLARIAFKLHDKKLWIDEEQCVPFDVTFKNYSPYKNNGKYEKCKEVEWSDFIKPKAGKIGDKTTEDWFSEERKEIAIRWSNKLKAALEYSSEKPNTIYIQAEHTAQVARSIIKEKTEKFKKGEINIMACSTTMEMGVDLGDLDLVLMNNVPPYPANYKQRAGRAGRGDQNKSAAMTICGSDITGESLMKDPLGSMIKYKVLPPKVDMQSKQLIQRHVNSYLLRKFIQIEFDTFSAGKSQVYNMFLGQRYEIQKHSIKKGKRNINIDVLVNDNTILAPGDCIISLENSLYNKFINYLDSWSIDQNIVDEINILVDNIQYKQDAVDFIKETKNQIEAIASYVSCQLDSIKKSWDNLVHKDNSNTNNSIKAILEKNSNARIINYEFTTLMTKNLLSFLSTHQFTPNANMPIDVVDLILYDNEFKRAENPTRDIRVALSEYAPGQMVFINGNTYLMGGVKWDRTKKNSTLRQCANGHVWITSLDKCPKCGEKVKAWKDFGENINIMTPIGFYPHKETSRMTVKPYNSLLIGVELIGVGNWDQPQYASRLYSIRSNDDGPGSYILFYNKGIGYGYHICTDCGYAVPATSFYRDNDKDSSNLMACVYPGEYTKKNKKRIKYHDYGKRCEYDDDPKLGKILKNIVLGGIIQTDYCEIALHAPAGKDSPSKEVATTLGLLLCRELSRKIICERGDIDFIPREQDNVRSICIFDTAKGGVGYSKRLMDRVLLEELFDEIRIFLSKNQTSISALLDRTTMKYSSLIDIRATMEWLNSEYQLREVAPKEIRCLFPDKEVRVLHFDNLLNNVKASESILFFNGSNFKQWNYKYGDMNWLKNRKELGITGSNKTFAIYKCPSFLSSDEELMLKLASEKSEWKLCKYQQEKIYPIAQIGNTLYFTINEAYSWLNEKWAKDEIFAVEYKIDLSGLNYSLVGDEHCILEEGKQITSKELFSTLFKESKKLQEFIKTIEEGHKLSFTYHEEYLRTHLGMTIALQFMLEFANKANATIANIEIQGEEYDDSYLENSRRGDYDRQSGYPNKLWANCLNSRQRDEYIEDNFLISLKDCSKIENYSVESLQKGELPHWRNLIIKDENTGDVINILPNGGFANGWSFDKDRANERYYPSNCDIDTEIPIKSEERIMYDIKIGEL